MNIGEKGKSRVLEFLLVSIFYDIEIKSVFLRSNIDLCNPFGMRKACVLFSVLFVLLILQPFEGHAVSYVPPVENYSVEEYKAGNQNWATAQGENGWIFVGNNRGLLSFDGIRWQLHKLPNNNAVRSILVAPGGRVYVGSFEEFGFFEIDSRGLFHYTSLKDSLSDYVFNNDEIWTISLYRDKYYFQSFSSFFVYDGERVTVGQSGLTPLYFFSLDGELYAQFLVGGLARKNNDGFEELIPKSQLNNDHVVSVLPYNDGLLLTTVMNGLYLYVDGKVSPWKTPAGDWLKTTIANRGIMLADSTYVVGTIANGLVGFDKQGEILWKVNQENSLMNNTVLGLSVDSAQNIWVALDNGIARIQTDSPIRYADLADASFGMVNGLVVDRENTYLATNQGVFLLKENEVKPRMLPNSEEQAWYISDVDDQLFVGHNKGILQIENEQAVRLPGEHPGGTVLQKCVIHGQEILLQASYSVLSVFVRDDDSGRWVFSHAVEGFSNLIKSFEVDFSGNIWASHMHRGIYRLQLDNSLRKVKEQEYIGKLSPESKEGIINVMKLRGRLVLTDGYWFYTYDDMSRKIIPYERMNQAYADLADTYRIVAYDNDSYWFVSNKEYALMAFEEGNLKLRARVPFSLLDNPPIENRGNVYVDKDRTVYFCLNGGFALFDVNRKIDLSSPGPVSLAAVKVFSLDNKQTDYLPLDPREPVRINYAYNNIRFDLAVPISPIQADLVAFRLEGFENEWSEKSADFSKTYSNLPYGDYVLHAVVYHRLTNKESSFSYAFSIAPPFYKSNYAYALYLVLTLLFLALLIRLYVNWELANEKKIAAHQHQLQEEQLKQQEQTIIKLEKEKLEDELTYKSKELASATLSVISHNEFLEQLKAEVQSQKLTGRYSKSFFDKLLRMINDNITKEGDWKVFQTNFDRIHENFFVKLKERYPDLTPGDLRMCALLRLNMPTKDMAGMLNLSVRGVEAARYRLRKKLNLAEGESLTDFVIKFE